MRNFLCNPLTRIICWFLALLLSGLLPAGNEARASFITQMEAEKEQLDTVSLVVLQTALENKLILEKLSKLGFSEEDSDEWISQLNDEEREVVLKELGTIQSGGGGYSTGLSGPILPPEARVYFIVLLILILVLLNKGQNYK